MLVAEVKAYVSSVDLKQLPACYAGKEWSGEMVKTLPEGVDPCGERGEFHMIVVAGPMFRHPIPITIGEIVEREGFAYAESSPRSWPVPSSFPRTCPSASSATALDERNEPLMPLIRKGVP